MNSIDIFGFQFLQKLNDKIYCNIRQLYLEKYNNMLSASVDVDKSVYDGIVNLRLPGIKSCLKGDMVRIFGEDVTGVSICCTDDKKLLLIHCNKNTYSPRLEDATNFAYSCNVIERAMPHLQATKLWVTMRMPDSAEIAVGKRSGFECILMPNMQSLVTEVSRFVSNFFFSHTMASVSVGIAPTFSQDIEM